MSRVRLRWGVGRLVALIGFTVVMTGLGIYQVRRQYDLVQLGYAIDRDLFEYRRELEVKKRLALSLAAYKDPMAVRAFAEDALGMKVPSPENELRIPAGDEKPAPSAPLFGQAGAAPDAGGAP
ncbi:MAG: cell division protein FtsL [Myxococcales bacterium]|nr:cell division protein FtsL [Myxococcales bacterium]MCB9731335.1 cell division protein FtsL [Deltaproteobacteria bacterium]